MRTVHAIALMVPLGLWSCGDPAVPEAPAPLAGAADISDPADTASPADAPAGDGSAGNGSTDAGAAVPEDAAPEARVEDAEGPTELGGGILLFELEADLLNTAGAAARFTLENPLAGDGQNTVHGPCATTVADPDAPADPPYFGYDAGLVMIPATNPPTVLMPADEGEDGTGYTSDVPEDQETLLPQGGALLTIQGEGGEDIPAFTLVVQTPESVNLITPQTGLFAKVPDDEDLGITWVPGNGDAILVTLTPLTSTFEAAAGTGLVCGAEGDPGDLMIPASALQAITADGNTRVALGVTRVKTGTADAGDWIVPAVVTRSTGGLLMLD